MLSSTSRWKSLAGNFDEISTTYNNPGLCLVGLCYRTLIHSRLSDTPVSIGSTMPR